MATQSKPLMYQFSTFYHSPPLNSNIFYNTVPINVWFVTFIDLIYFDFV